MYNPMSSIIRSAKRKPDEPLNILTFPAHERYESCLCQTGHNFYSVVAEGTKEWNEVYAAIPPNYTIFNNVLPDYVLGSIDMVLSHNPFVHIPLAHRIGLRVPVVNIFHTMPVPQWNPDDIPHDARVMFDWCTEHIYISEFSKKAWGYDGKVIHHAIDTDLFCLPGNGPMATTPQRNPVVLTVANDYINRDWCLGFSIWNAIAPELPMLPVGDTPGLSNPAPDVPSLVKTYQSSQVFLNTSTLSPIPTSLLEAMACGCACVSSDPCLIPEIIEDGVDGYLCPVDQPVVFAARCKHLLNNPHIAEQMGRKAAAKVKSMFGIDRFVKEFNEAFRSVL